MLRLDAPKLPFLIRKEFRRPSCVRKSSAKKSLFLGQLHGIVVAAPDSWRFLIGSLASDQMKAVPDLGTRRRTPGVHRCGVNKAQQSSTLTLVDFR